MNFYIKYLLWTCRVTKKYLGWIPGMKAYIGFFERSYTKHQKAWTIYGLLSLVLGTLNAARVYYKVVDMNNQSSASRYEHYVSPQHSDINCSVCDWRSSRADNLLFNDVN